MNKISDCLVVAREMEEVADQAVYGDTPTPKLMRTWAKRIARDLSGSVEAEALSASLNGMAREVERGAVLSVTPSFLVHTADMIGVAYKRAIA